MTYKKTKEIISPKFIHLFLDIKLIEKYYFHLYDVYEMGKKNIFLFGISLGWLIESSPC